MTSPGNPYSPPAPAPTPPPPRKSWLRKHPVLTALSGVAAGVVAGAVILGIGDAQAPAQRPLPAISQPTASPYTNPAAPSPTGPPVATVGESFFATQDGQDAAVITIQRVETSTTPVDAYSSGPQHGYFVDVLVTVRVKNGFTGGFDVSPLDFYAKTGSAHWDEGDGNAYEGPRSNSELDSPTLGAGETTTGWLVFDLPSAHGKIAYAPNYDGGALGYWRF